jgi:hypothetical protein
MKVRHIARRQSERSHLSWIEEQRAWDHYWHPSAIEGGWDDDEEFWQDGSDYWDEPDHDWREGDDDDCDVDTCVGCGRAYGPHWGLSAWDRDREGGIAPQLCHRCWRDQGYAWPERLTA